LPPDGRTMPLMVDTLLTGAPRQLGLENEMRKLLKYTGDIKKALRTVNAIMQNEKYDFVTWTNSQTGARFIAKKETVKKMYLNKFENGAEVNSAEIVKICDSSLTLNEMQEAGAGSTLKEGWGGKETTNITKKDINFLEEVLYNDKFDCSILFND